MVTETASCPACGGEGETLPGIGKEFGETVFEIHRCRGCGLCYTVPFPTEEQLRAIYSGAYWLTNRRGNVAARTTKGLVQSFNRLRLAVMIRPLVRKLSPGSRILDIGCGSGLLAGYLKEKGFEVEVTDINASLLQEVREKHGIPGYCGDIEDISFAAPYDAVILNNVLEHLFDPLVILRKVSALVKQDGLVFIEVPNIESLQFRLFANRWFPLQLPEHLYHFSPATLNMLAGQAGLHQQWFSTFSPRVSPAGYVASLFPGLRPEKLRRSMAKPLLACYLLLQLLVLPVTLAESTFGRGAVVRVIYSKAGQS